MDMIFYAFSVSLSISPTPPSVFNRICIVSVSFQWTPPPTPQHSPSSKTKEQVLLPHFIPSFSCADGDTITSLPGQL